MLFKFCSNAFYCECIEITFKMLYFTTNELDVLKSVVTLLAMCVFR